MIIVGGVFSLDVTFSPGEIGIQLFTGCVCLQVNGKRIPTLWLLLDKTRYSDKNYIYLMGFTVAPRFVFPEDRCRTGLQKLCIFLIQVMDNI
jgi:hypothetical protein